MKNALYRAVRRVASKSVKHKPKRNMKLNMRVSEMQYPSEVRMKQFNSNLKRFSLLLGVDEGSFEHWANTFVTTMGMNAKNAEFDIFCDERGKEVAIYNEHGVPVYQNFNQTNEFV